MTNDYNSYTEEVHQKFQANMVYILSPSPTGETQQDLVSGKKTERKEVKNYAYQIQDEA